MLPNFPDFKRIELSDRTDVLRITKKYEPYSDFDFAGMWSWDINGKYQLSQLNGNLVVILSDHFTDELFYSYIGNNEINKTLKQLFAFPLTSTNQEFHLKTIPEVSLEGIDLKKYIIEIDLNNYDYIYDLNEHVSFVGNKYAAKRKMSNKFLRTYIRHDVKILDLRDSKVQKAIFDLTEFWISSKVQEKSNLNYFKEFLALKKFLSAGFKEELGVGTFINGKLEGYEIFSLLKNNYAISFFAKTNSIFPGLYENQVSKSATILLKKGIKLLNAEEDLGIESLRKSKNSYRPIKFLRKYTISER